MVSPRVGRVPVHAARHHDVQVVLRTRDPVHVVVVLREVHDVVHELALVDHLSSGITGIRRATGRQ